MPSDKKVWQGKVFGEIAGHLKNYPFLLIALAAIVVLSLVIVFDIEKLKTITTLLMVMIVFPIACQFIIELTKLLKGDKGHKEPPDAADRFPEKSSPQNEQVELFHKGARPVTIANPDKKKISSLAIIGFILMLYMLFAIGDVIGDDIVESNTALGAFVLSSLSLMLALIAIIDVKMKLCKGRILALINFVISAICMLVSIGMYVSADNSSPSLDSSGERDNATILMVCDHDCYESNFRFDLDGIKKG